MGDTLSFTTTGAHASGISTSKVSTGNFCTQTTRKTVRRSHGQAMQGTGYEGTSQKFSCLQNTVKQRKKLTSKKA